MTEKFGFFCLNKQQTGDIEINYKLIILGVIKKKGLNRFMNRHWQKNRRPTTHNGGFYFFYHVAISI